MNTREKGNSGEDMAVEYLINNGYSIIVRNYQLKSGEIDCIAETEDGTLVFIEVKSGNATSYGHPFYRVTKSKQKRLALLAQHYLKNNYTTNKKCRFDVIAVINGNIEHLTNAFLV